MHSVRRRRSSFDDLLPIVLHHHALDQEGVLQYFLLAGNLARRGIKEVHAVALRVQIHGEIVPAEHMANFW